MYIVQCTMYIEHCTLYIVYCAIINAQYKFCIPTSIKYIAIRYSLGSRFTLHG